MRIRAFVAPVVLLLLMMAAVQAGAAPDNGAVHDADAGAVRALFEGKRFAELTALLEGYQASCDNDVSYEYAAHNGFAAFATHAPSYGPLLDEWLRGAPRSWVPLTARAAYRKAAGWRARGNKPARETTPEQFRGMIDNFLLAVRDLEASLVIRPRQLYAYVILMEMSQTVGDPGRDARLAAKALALYPDSYLVRYRRMLSLAPRWGGSYDAMDRFAEETAPRVRANPRLALLPGLIAWDQARAAEGVRDYPMAIALYERALYSGVTWDFLFDLANCYYRAKLYREALAALDRAMAVNPRSAEGHGLRSKIAFAQGKWDEAIASLGTMERLEGAGAAEASAIRQWESRRLVADGHALFRRDLPGAIARYTLAIRFDPKNADAYFGRGIASDRTGRTAAAVADLRQAIALEPRMFPAYKALDDALYKQRRVDEIIDAWSRLLKLEPGNDNAYVERSGAYSRKGDKASALRDLDRACGMGNDQACYLLMSLPGARPR